MLNTIVRYATKECPDCIQFIEYEHDISQILAQQATENGQYYWSSSDSDAELEDEERNGASTSNEHLASDIQLPASFTDSEETLLLPFPAQFDDIYEDEDQRITDIYATSSLSEQTSNFPSQKRRRNSSTPNPPTKRRKV